MMPLFSRLTPARNALINEHEWSEFNPSRSHFREAYIVLISLAVRRQPFCKMADLDQKSRRSRHVSPRNVFSTEFRLGSVWFQK